MAIPHTPHPERSGRWALLPSGAEMHDYQQLCKEVLLVIVSFLLLGLFVALVAAVVPGLMPT